MDELDMMVLSNTLRMLVPPIVFALLMFFLQRWLCLSKRAVLTKIVPGGVLATLTAICVWQIWLWNRNGHTLYFVISFLAGMSLAGMLLGCTAAWARYLIGKYVQKRRK